MVFYKLGYLYTHFGDENPEQGMYCHATLEGAVKHALEIKEKLEEEHEEVKFKLVAENGTYRLWWWTDEDKYKTELLPCPGRWWAWAKIDIDEEYVYD